jgi:hypothetical protein
MRICSDVQDAESVISRTIWVIETVIAGGAKMDWAMCREVMAIENVALLQGEDERRL